MLGGFMRAYLILTAAIALAVLSGCASTPRPAADLPIPKATPLSAALWRDNTKEGDRIAEDRALKQFPQLARREGVDLYILRNGKILAKRTSDPQNCQGFDTCKIWLFHDGIRLIDAHTGKLDTFVQLDFRHGEGGHGVIIDGSGKDVDIDYVGLASPDGRFIASGLDCSDCGYLLTITDWTGKQKTVAFPIPCRPVAWLDRQRFSADCEVFDIDTGVKTKAEVSQSSGGQWHLKELSATDYDTGAKLPDRTLKTFTAEAVE
jgi:hypothetical protein